MICVKNEIVKKQHNFWNHIHFHPTDAIEDEWGQKILNEVAKDKVAQTVRIYAMLEDIVTMDENGNLVYDFTENDVRMDYMVEKGFNLFVTYCFIPPCIAENTELLSSMSKNKTRYKGKYIIASKPTDYALWGEICRKYAEHIVERYGIDLVSNWYMQCFNEPDGAGFFLADVTSHHTRYVEYCKLYENFAKGVKRVSQRLKVGGSATTEVATGIMEGFLNYVKKNNLPLDFADAHTYGTFPDGLNKKTRLLSIYNNIGTLYVYRSILKKYGFENTELIMDEWGPAGCGFFNIEECPAHIFRENSIFSTYFVKMVTDIINNDINISKMLLCLSGQHEMKEDFSGFRNFFTLNFIKKPAYNGFVLMAKIKENILKATCDNHYVTTLASKDEDTYAIAVTYSSEHFEDDLPLYKDTIEIDGIKGEKEVRIYVIDEKHTNPYNLYLAKNYTKDLTKEQIEELKEEGKLKPVKQYKVNAEGKLLIDIELTANGVAFIEF